VDTRALSFKASYAVCLSYGNHLEKNKITSSSLQKDLDSSILNPHQQPLPPTPFLPIVLIILSTAQPFVNQISTHTHHFLSLNSTRWLRQMGPLISLRPCSRLWRLCRATSTGSKSTKLHSSWSTFKNRLVIIWKFLLFKVGGKEMGWREFCGRFFL